MNEQHERDVAESNLREMMQNAAADRAIRELSDEQVRILYPDLPAGDIDWDEYYDPHSSFMTR